jgi:glycosyltransferase involved in cell wall biosynthesis
MRVLFFSRNYTTHDRRFLEKIAASGHQVFFLRLETTDGGFTAEPLPERVCPIEWSGLNEQDSLPEGLLRLAPEFESVLREVKPDLVHAGPVQLCGFLTALVGFRPFALMSWGSDMLVEAYRDGVRNWMTRYCLERADIFVCDCEAVKRAAQKLSDYPEERIVQFPWGVDLNAFSPGEDLLHIRQKLGWQNALIILATRAWEKSYGIEIMLESFAHAYRSEPRLRMLLLGSGHATDYVHKFLRDQRLTDVVHCPGVVAEKMLPNYFRSADVYFNCSPSDGTSISLLQALATGMPVVVTDSEGNREWVQDEKNGWLAPAGDAAGFSTGLLRAASLNERRRTEIHGFNLSIARDRADWDRNIDKLLKAYDRIEREIFSALSK